jgi:hypothetical protein
MLQEHHGPAERFRVSGADPALRDSNGGRLRGFEAHEPSILDSISDVASSVPILVIAYRRADLVAQVIDAVRVEQPQRLYVAFDGPRPGEEGACEETRRTVVERVDWPCTLEQLVRPTNRGCRLGVSEAIDWFFSEVNEGIILEDDTVPSRSFFRYCSELLDRYANDERIWMISGTNLLGTWPSRDSYFFGDGGVWGWATWRRAWLRSDTAFSAWNDATARRSARAFYGDREWHRLAPQFEAVHSGALDTWDYQWSFARAMHGGLSVIAAENLVANIGFDTRATHTADGASPLAALTAQELRFPLAHPDTMTFDRQYQRAIRQLQPSSRLSGLRRRASRLIGRTGL